MKAAEISNSTADEELGLEHGRRLAVMDWLGRYQRKWFRGDLIAGITLAAYMLPAGLGDASLAGLPPQAGLYACLAGGLVFWLFCSSRQTAVTVTSAISLLLGTTLGPLAGGDTGRFAAMAAGTALLMGVISLICHLLGAGMIVNFISETVMLGFKGGVALFLASTQLPKLFGIQGSHGGSFWERSGHFLSHLHETNKASLAIGLGAVVILLLGKVFLKNRPVALFVVIGAIALGAMANLEAHQVKLLGAVPRGLPPVGVPMITWADLNNLLPLALACFLLGAVETAAIGRMFAAERGDRFDSNQELLALATSNMAVGLAHGFPVSGGMSQSLVNKSGGARTPLSGLAAAMVILIVTVFLSGLLKTLPQPALAGIILVAVTGLFKPDAFKHLWHSDRTEFFIAFAALMGVLGSGLLRGVLVGSIISLLQLLRRASSPHVGILGRIPGAERYSDMERHPDNLPTPGVLIVRPEGALVYFNVERVRDVILKRFRAESPRPSLVICDLSASPQVDLAGTEMFTELHHRLENQNARLQIVEARASVRDRLRRHKLDERVGGVNRFTSVAEAVREFQMRQNQIAPPSPATPPTPPADGLPDITT